MKPGHSSRARKGQRSRVIMIAAENDALKGAKVGGIADVIRDLPDELAPLGWDTTVIVPSYGFLHTLNPAEKIADVTFPFGGREEFCEIWEAKEKRPHSGAQGTEHLIVHHRSIGGDPIYFNDPPENVYGRDATKFALFCSAAGQYLRSVEGPYVLHLHDWHTGYLFLLAELHPAFVHLRGVRKIFTIHNVGFQGSRPMRGRSPSLEDWFPELFRKPKWMSVWEDARYREPTFTPMLAGIRHAAVVTTVSPTYAREITTADDRANAIYGGEGLEVALRAAHDEGRLVGILNGVDYPASAGATTPAAGRGDDRKLIATIAGDLAEDTSEKAAASRDEVDRRLRRLFDGTGRCVLTSITRITEQKVRLMFEKGSDGRVALESILALLGERGAGYILVGSGDDGYERALGEAFRKHGHFVFLNGFYKNSAERLFRRGDLFLMPSSYEPCGITQLLAMREGQPCLVHAVGGLKDTVLDGVNGFTFNGKTLTEKVDNFIAAVRGALGLFYDEPSRWRMMVEAARRARFGWEAGAKQYADLYTGDAGSA